MFIFFFAIFGCADNFWPSLNGYVFDVTRHGLQPQKVFVNYSYTHDPNIQFPFFLNVHTVTYISLPAVYIKVCKSCRTEKRRGRFWDNHSLIIVANEIFLQTRSMESMSLHCSHPGTKSPADLGIRDALVSAHTWTYSIPMRFFSWICCGQMWEISFYAALMYPTKISQKPFLAALKR